MFEPFLEVTYDPKTNTASSIYRCGETEELISYEGQRDDLVKFTAETWPEYLDKLYGRSLPVMVDGYGYIKYIQDAIAIGVPESVYSQFRLRDKDVEKRTKIDSIIVERRDYEGNLLERRVIFNEDNAVWFSFDNGTLDVPEGMNPVDFAVDFADEVIKAERERKLK